MVNYLKLPISPAFELALSQAVGVAYLVVDTPACREKPSPYTPPSTKNAKMIRVNSLAFLLLSGGPH
jgi:hypothetical protein